MNLKITALVTGKWTADQEGRMAPRGRFELPRRDASGFRDHRLTGLDYLGLTPDSHTVIYL